MYCVSRCANIFHVAKILALGGIECNLYTFGSDSFDSVKKVSVSIKSIL